MAITRLPRSEYITDDVLDELFKRSDVDLDSKEKPNKSQEVADIVFEVDPIGKALTGRTPKKIEEETGIPVEEMFPKDSKILYIGDPWQKMGTELDQSHGSNLTIIDYEYGEVASFIFDEKNFRDNIKFKGTYLLELLNDILNDENKDQLEHDDFEWLTSFLDLVKHAHSLSEAAVTDEEYLSAAEAWKKSREYIETTYKNELEKKEQASSEPGDSYNYDDNLDKLGSLKTYAWYEGVYGERGFRDTLDWKNIIEPKVKALESDLKGLPEAEKNKEIASATKSWIEEIRLHKRTESSNVLEAVFPQLPFKDDSFDRMVASWSISAHVFAELDETGFEVLWDETQRILKEGGKAYIFPLNYYYEVDSTIISSLENMKIKHKLMDYTILDDESGNKYTLVITKRSSGDNN